jgi:hypothetical protein
MRYIAITCLVAMFAGQQNFNANSPIFLIGKVHAALQPYFPNVRESAEDKQHYIVAVTCTTGIGHDLVVKLANSLSNDPDVRSKLSTMSEAKLLGYESILVGFETDFIRYDTSSGKFSVIPRESDTRTQYNHNCQFGQNSQP